MRLIILGAGGYGRTIADIACQNGYNCIFLDDSDPEHPLKSYCDYIDENTEFIPAFGNNVIRMEWINKLKKAGAHLATLIHPTAYVSPRAVIYKGSVVLPKAVVNTSSVVESGCIINLGAIIDHGCVIEEGCHICLGAIVKGENRIQTLTKIEAGEVIQARQWPVNLA
jgi:UDP-3-O-[3-hydroxymyristoyl] glucosamine N-acyltransferase